jgi:hypothetical protein
MFITVTESWNDSHNEKESELIQAKDAEITEKQSVYIDAETKSSAFFPATGGAVRAFLTQEAADDYVAFINTMNPASVEIKTFDTEDQLKEFLSSIA